MGRMTAETTQIILTVRRARKVRVILPRSMAFQAALVYRLRGYALEAEDLRLIAAAFDVVLPHTMASFATLFGCAATLVQHGFPVRGLVKVVVDIFVTGFAGLGTGILRCGAPQSGLLFPMRKT